MSGYADTVASWQAHLRAGGTTTWREWRADAPATSDQDPGVPAAALPDAAHLELLRRLNGVPGGREPGLHEQVLRTPAPGRGLLEAPLAWPERPRPFGSPPVEPELLPDEELVRLAVGVLVRLLPRLAPVVPVVPPTRWPWPWRRRVQVHGSPGTAAAVRAMLQRRGVLETDWQPLHVVVARPLEAMMAEHWAAAGRDGGILSWRTLWRRAQALDRLPPGIDVLGLVERLEGRRREPVHVVVAHDAQHVAALVADLVGVREVESEASGELAESDLLRRVNRLLGVTAGPERVRDLTARLCAHALAEVPAGEPQAPFVPAPAYDWAVHNATATAEHLREAGYPVLGDPGALLPTGPPLDVVVDRARTLELALAACVRAWRESQHEQEGP